MEYLFGVMPRRPTRIYPDLETFFEESGVTQKQFARRINKTQSYVSKVTNRRIEPSIADALLIAKEASVPLESLIKTEGAPSNA